MDKKIWVIILVMIIVLIFVMANKLVNNISEPKDSITQSCADCNEESNEPDQPNQEQPQTPNQPNTPSTPGNPAASDQPTETGSWHFIRTFSGQETTSTDIVNIQGNKWRINWQCKESQSQTGVFSLFVYPEGQTRGYIANVLISECDQSSILNINNYQGDYYFKIIAGNLNSWQIDIEDYY